MAICIPGFYSEFVCGSKSQSSSSVALCRNSSSNDAIASTLDSLIDSVIDHCKTSIACTVRPCQPYVRAWSLTSIFCNTGRCIGYCCVNCSIARGGLSWIAINISGNHLGIDAITTNNIVWWSKNRTDVNVAILIRDYSGVGAIAITRLLSVGRCTTLLHVYLVGRDWRSIRSWQWPWNFHCVSFDLCRYTCWNGRNVGCKQTQGTWICRITVLVLRLNLEIVGGTRCKWGYIVVCVCCRCKNAKASTLLSIIYSVLRYRGTTVCRTCTPCQS
jgi:hypothetical protein